MLEIITYGSSSAGNSYLLKDGKHSLLLEAGVSPKRMRGWQQADGLLVTHEHGDHAKYTKDLLKRSGLTLYCSRGTAQALKTPKHRTLCVQERKAYWISRWGVTPFAAEHDAAEPLGFLITTPSREKVLFATDTARIPYRFNGITHMLIECNHSLEILKKRYSKQEIDIYRLLRVMYSHHSLEQLELFLKNNDLSTLKEIHLIHLSDQNSDEEQFKKKIKELTGVAVYAAPRHGGKTDEYS